jgi:hypothetical protein
LFFFVPVSENSRVFAFSDNKKKKKKMRNTDAEDMEVGDLELGNRLGFILTWGT